jgi:nanoRNase/pAp phosphatase (c-di-AMP/oligoRNAs hydrolase)
MAEEVGNMDLTTQIVEFGRLVSHAETILLLQPDKPDGDSLSSMLALEAIFSDLGKTVVMYCAGRIEPYLRHNPGWDRVRLADDFPTEAWDLAVLVDTPSPDQVARLLGPHHAELNRKPWVVVDHHDKRTPIEGVSLDINVAKAAAASEVLYKIAVQLDWPLSSDTCSRLVAALYADTLNLTTSSVTVDTIQTFSALVTKGNLQVSELHRVYREAAATDPDLLLVKGKLLESLELHHENQIALIIIPEELVKAYRERTSLSSLVMFEILWARGIKVAAVVSDYGSIVRTSLRARVPIAGIVAERLGGGGHPQAAAFSSQDVPVADLRNQLLFELSQELDRVAP